MKETIRIRLDCLRYEEYAKEMILCEMLENSRNFYWIRKKA